MSGGVRCRAVATLARDITSGAHKRPPTCTSPRWFTDVASIGGNAGTAPLGAEGSRELACAGQEHKMNIDRFTQLLTGAFRKTASEQVQDAQARTLRKWRPLAPQLDKALEGEEAVEEYSGTFEAWPGNVRELLEQHGLARSLLTFDWDGFGPVSWSAGLVAIETGGVGYVLQMGRTRQLPTARGRLACRRHGGTRPDGRQRGCGRLSHPASAALRLELRPAPTRSIARRQDVRGRPPAPSQTLFPAHGEESDRGPAAA